MFACVYVYTGLSSFSSFCIFSSFSHFGFFFLASLSCLLGCSCVALPLANTHDPVWVLLLPLCCFQFLFVLFCGLYFYVSFLAFFCSLLKSLFECLASTCLGKTVTPTVGRDSPPAKAPLKP